MLVNYNENYPLKTRRVSEYILRRTRSRPLIRDNGFIWLAGRVQASSFWPPLFCKPAAKVSPLVLATLLKLVRDVQVWSLMGLES